MTVHDDAVPSPLEDNPIWRQENVRLRSVGVDVGSSGTQVVFSRLRLRRMGEDLTSRYVVVERAPVYRSPVAFTPYRGSQIDAEQLGTIIDEAYAAAAQRPEDIDTGAVILTGEAVRRRNARRIAAVVSSRAGSLVCATAGHHMEAMLAAYGSGAARYSHDSGGRILNIDMGGGTTKLALVENGRVLRTAAVHLGGRLLVVDGARRIERLEPAGRDHAAAAGFTWDVGDTVSDADLDAVAEWMAHALVTALTAARPLPPEVAGLDLTEPIGDLGVVDGVMFSGGVAEYVYRRETRDFGDLGRRLGAAVRHRVEDGSLPFRLVPAGECIRATVLGASEYTVQLSGVTSYISDPSALLPRRDVPVVRPEYDLGDTVDADAIAAAVRERFAASGLNGSGADVALALRWAGVPSHERLLAFATGLARGLAGRGRRDRAVYLVLDGDVALSLGSILRDELGVSADLLVIDGLRLWEFDYVDLGRVRFPSNTVPVTIKSLVFGDDPRSAVSAEG